MDPKLLINLSEDITYNRDNGNKIPRNHERKYKEL